MRTLLSILSLFTTMLITACGVTPQTFDEALTEHRATRNDMPDWEKGMRYRIELQYALTAREKIDMPTIDVPRDTSVDIMVPFAIWEFARGNNFGGTMGFLDWFNSGLSDENTYRYYFNQGLRMMGEPNTHYFTIDDRDGIATEDDVRSAWDESHELFSAIQNASGQCHVWGFTEKHQYALTYPKDVPGKYKEVLYECPHPLFSGKTYRVYVFAFANVSPNTRVVAGVATRCDVKPPPGEQFVDTRRCGDSLADMQRSQLTESRFGWMELVTTPQETAPHQFEIVARFGGKETTLPAPELTEDYIEFLKQTPY